MAAPTVRSVSIGAESSNVTTHNITLPATVAAGDLLYIQWGGESPFTSLSTPSGWTEHLNSAEAVMHVAIWTKTADGTEGGTTIQVTSSEADTSAYIAYAIAGADVARFDFPGLLQRNGTFANHPRVEPAAGLNDYLFLSPVWIKAFSAVNDPVTSPAGYSNQQMLYSKGSGGRVQLTSAQKAETQVTEETPGATNWIESLNNWASTVAFTAGAVSGPTITDTVPAAPFPGQQGVQINGSGFGASQGASTVTYGGLPVTVTGWSNTQITVTWPAVNAPSSTLGFNTDHTLEVTVV